MAQFDVHRSPGRNRAVPYVVVIQSRAFDHMPTRLVAPLAVTTEFKRSTQQLAPVFTIEGHSLLFLAWQIQTVRASALGPVIASLADDASSGAIINAIDSMITRSYG